jgi:hypothetical protein
MIHAGVGPPTIQAMDGLGRPVGADGEGKGEYEERDRHSGSRARMDGTGA